MKHEIGFVGIGQGGSNLVDEMYELGYDSLLVNTTHYDLASNKCPNQYHLAGTKGCNKDRKKALNVALEKHKQLGEIIYSTFPKKKAIYIVVATGGGTGSGFAPLTIEYLKSVYPHITFNLVMILPSLDEDTKNLKNAISFYEDLEKVDGVTGIYALDNNNADRFEINKEFASKFEKMMRISNPDKRGVIDNAELENILSAKGCVYIATIKDNFTHTINTTDNNFTRTVNLGRLFENQTESNIFSPTTYGCKYMAISLPHDKININSLDTLVGNPTEDRYIGYNNNNEHLIIVTGMSFPKQIIAQMINEVNKRESQRNIYQPRYNVEMPKLNTKAIKIEENYPTPDKKIDINAIFDKFK